MFEDWHSFSVSSRQFQLILTFDIKCSYNLKKRETSQPVRINHKIWLQNPTLRGPFAKKVGNVVCNIHRSALLVIMLNG